MYDDFLVISNCGKLSAKFVSGTLMVIEKVGFMSFFFSFLVQTTYYSSLIVLKLESV